jgi:hypothetical protein
MEDGGLTLRFLVLLQDQGSSTEVGETKRQCVIAVGDRLKEVIVPEIEMSRHPDRVYEWANEDCAEVIEVREEEEVLHELWHPVERVPIIRGVSTAFSARQGERVSGRVAWFARDVDPMLIVGENKVALNCIGAIDGSLAAQTTLALLLVLTVEDVAETMVLALVLVVVVFGIVAFTRAGLILVPLMQRVAMAVIKVYLALLFVLAMEEMA